MGAVLTVPRDAFADESSWSRFASAAKEAGFVDVELPGFSIALADQVRRAGFAPVAVRPEVDAFSIAALSCGDVERRVDAVRVGASLLRQATSIEARFLVVASRGADEPTCIGGAVTPYVERLHHLLDSMRKLAGEAELAGVSLALEPGGAGFLTSPADCAELVDQVNCPYVGICLSAPAIAVFACPAEWALSLRSRLLSVRIEESADCRFPRVFEALKSIRFAGSLVLTGGPGWAGRIREEMASWEGQEVIPSSPPG